MASEQLPRRENTTNEREIQVEKLRVPKMTTHFEHLAGQAKESDVTGGKETPQGSTEALQGGEHNKEHGGKARETHELGTQFESLVDKVKGEDLKEKKESDHRGNIVGDKKGEQEELERQKGRGRESIEKGRGKEEEDKAREKNERPSTWEEISKHGDEDQKNTKERYERAKQDKTTQRAQEKSGQAKDIAMEKASQAKDTTKEKGQQCYATTKDTITGAAKTAVEYTAPVAEKAKGYTLQAAEKAKDVTVGSGKTAAQYAGKVAADIKDKATVAGWTAANYSAEKTVEGTKAAANVVGGATGYAGYKAAELAAKSVGAVKGLAASAGETAKEYTARKKEEAKKELEAKKASQNQEGEERPSKNVGETVSQNAQKIKPSGEILQRGQEQGSTQERKGSNLAEQGQEGQGGGVLSAIGETISDIAQTTKSMVIGDDKGESRQSFVSHEGYQAPKSV